MISSNSSVEQLFELNLTNISSAFMATSTLSSGSSHDEDHNSPGSLESQLTLPIEKGRGPVGICQYQGFWFPEKELDLLKSFLRHFEARDSDIILATLPRSGTIWLKSLVFSTVYRATYNLSQHPLLTKAPHEIVPFIEMMDHGNDTLLEFTAYQSPRIFGTHIPYASLPNTIKNSECKVVYLCRNPRDNFISYWHFTNKFPNAKPISLEEAFNLFCSGVSLAGPFWDQVLGFWNASLENPKKILFLKYEDMKKNTTCFVKKLAEFLGCPFTQAEESGGVVNDILKLSSFEHMKRLDLNNKVSDVNLSAEILLRKGEVGDWMNYFTPSMIEQMDRIIAEKFQGSGLEFQYHLD